MERNRKVFISLSGWKMGIGVKFAMQFAKCETQIKQSSSKRTFIGINVMKRFIATFVNFYHNINHLTFTIYKKES